MILNHSSVYRGGESKDDWNKATMTNLSATVRELNQSVDIHFRIGASGGMSRIWVELKKSDIEALLTGIAEAMPSLAGTFADCASVAAKKNLVQLKKLAKKLKELPANGMEKLARNQLVRNI